MKNKKLVLSIILTIFGSAFVFAVDILSKYFIFSVLKNVGDSVEVVPGFFNFVHVENKGAAWGIFAGNQIFLIIISVAVLAVYLTFYILRLKRLKNKISITLSISVALVVGGCLGNLFDRIFLGYVRDFINLQFISFPVFNIADICVCLSVVFLFIYFIFVFSKEDELNKNIQKNSENNKKNEGKLEIIEEKLKNNEDEDKNEG